MKAILIIKKDNMNPNDMQHFGHDAMVNSIGICDCVLTDKVDGDKVKATIEGTLMEHDGMRFISVDMVDGKQVEDPEMPHDQNPDEGNMDQPMHDNGNVPDHAMMNSNDALANFMNNHK